MLLNASTKLAEAIHSNYLLLPILNRFGIHLGFGDKTVKQVCNELGVDQEFFLDIVNSFLDKEYFPKSELQSFPVNLIIDYIGKSHDYYVEKKIPQIENMIDRLLEETPNENKKPYQLIHNFFLEYKKELIDHINNEDQNVHPYIIKIDEAVRKNIIGEEIVRLVKEQSINIYADDHDNVEDKLFDLKNLIIKYLPPLEDYTLSNSILFELFRLERDLNDHARIEEKILVPKVQQIEQKILDNI